MMRPMKLTALARELDRLLASDLPADPSRNGLQVGGDWEVKKVALAVDAKMATFKRAAAVKADLLIVHHGLFWKEPILWRGHHFERIRFLVENRLALYAAHLPLDLHPRFGNNANLLRLIGLRPKVPFGRYAGLEIGYLDSFKRAVPLAALRETYRQELYSAGRLFGSGPNRVRTVAAVSGGLGGATSILEEAAAKKVDLLVTGEVTHSEIATIEDCAIQVLALGHYLSETVGLSALQPELTRRLGLKTIFIEHATGL